MNPPQVVGTMVQNAVTQGLSFVGQSLFPDVKSDCTGCSFFQEGNYDDTLQEHLPWSEKDEVTQLQEKFSSSS